MNRSACCEAELSSAENDALLIKLNTKKPRKLLIDCNYYYF